MRLYQYNVRGERAVVAAGEGGEKCVVPAAATTLELVARAGASAETLAAAVEEAWREGGKTPLPAGAEGPLLPLAPPEVWGFGVTYKQSATDRAADAGAASGDIYARAHAASRPEVFFKAAARHCVGPGEAVGIRGDSEFTAAEPELAYVVGRDNAIVAYTLGNDVSAWDLERENPLYLPQSKIYTACCALGPCLVTADEVEPDDVEIEMTIRRRGAVAFEGRTSTARLRHPIPYLHAYLTRYNPLPPGAVALTGTGIMTPAGFTLQEGDEVIIAAEPFGELANVARRLA